MSTFLTSDSGGYWESVKEGENGVEGGGGSLTRKFVILFV
jgi:hypothetical protein